MDYSGEQLETIFDRNVAHPIQQAIIRCIFNAYRIAFDSVSHFPFEEARDLRGYYRWIQLRYEMRSIGDRFSEVSATPERYHTLISAGHVRLIACSASDPKSPLRDASYRLEYANKSLNLYEPPAPTSSTDDFLFTVMAHGADRLQPFQPAFAKILFVTKDMKIWHEFDLFSRHIDLVKSLWTPLQTEHQDAMPDVRLRDEDEEQSQ